MLIIASSFIAKVAKSWEKDGKNGKNLETFGKKWKKLGKSSRKQEKVAKSWKSVIPLRIILDKRGSIGVHLYEKDFKWVKKWLNYGHFLPKRLGDSIENHMGQKGNPLVFICTKKDPKLARKQLSYGSFLPERLRDPLRNTWDKKGSFDVHLYQKDPKSVKKWLIQGHFPPERLRDSIESHMGQKGILLFSFVPKRSRIGQEMAELWSRGCVIPLRTTWDKRGSFGVDLYQKDLKSVKKWLSYGQEVE